MSMSDSNFVIIDDMKSINGWYPSSDLKHKCSINISSEDTGINISYNLEEPYSWVDISKNIDFSKIPEIDQLLFYFEGKGAPNTLELKLTYDDGTTFGYKRNRATDNNDSVYLSPWQITYFWGGASHLDTEPVDFSKVKQIHFAISNDPAKEDMPGNGYVVIRGIAGEKKPPQENVFEKYKDIIIAVITGIFGIATGYILRGRKEDPKERSPRADYGSKGGKNSSAKARYSKGYALAGQKKYEDAIQAYDEAIRLDPNLAVAWNNKGKALEALGKTAEANAAFAKAKELGYEG